MSGSANLQITPNLADPYYHVFVNPGSLCSANIVNTRRPIMLHSADTLWLEASKETAASYRRMIEGVVGQLTWEELQARPHPQVNSVAILLRHLGGNLRSRWTDFLTTDGEKPDRNREQEFEPWPGDQSSLMAYFDQGWHCLTQALAQMNATSIQQTLRIRGEAHTLPQAVSRSLAHVAYHVGQMALIARLVHLGDWKWLTIPPGGSQAHNATTWGNATSRGVFGGEEPGSR